MPPPLCEIRICYRSNRTNWQQYMATFLNSKSMNEVHTKAVGYTVPMIVIYSFTVWKLQPYVDDSMHSSGQGILFAMVRPVRVLET